MAEQGDSDCEVINIPAPESLYDDEKEDERESDVAELVAKVRSELLVKALAKLTLPVTVSWINLEGKCSSTKTQILTS